MAQPRPRSMGFVMARDQAMRRHAAPFSSLGRRDKSVNRDSTATRKHENDAKK